MLRNLVRKSCPLIGCITVAIFFSTGLFGADEPKPYRLPSVSMKQPILWAAQCELPDGRGLAFGGVDQTADDGAVRTRVKRDGKWVSISEDLRKANPLQAKSESLRATALATKEVMARARQLYFSGASDADQARDFQAAFAKLSSSKAVLGGSVGSREDGGDSQLAAQSEEAIARAIFPMIDDANVKSLPSEALPRLLQVQRLHEKAAESLDAEPAPRALSPIVYDAKTKVFILFGGDHLDYLTNDLWTFDPAASKWTMRRAKSAPAPRANHKLVAKGDGTLELTGGYTYANNTDYMGGQYVDINDGPFTYDLATDTWTGKGDLVAADSRTYRTGPFDPKFFMEGPPPDAVGFAKKLETLPANQWVMTDPPKLPKMQRDWGTAILDPDHDLILRWSGGHCAHGGTDVLQFHIATNRWELTAPVEFPLGQLYDNTEYPSGVSFNRRAWITGHTYQNYGYDPILKQMLYTGQEKLAFPYDPTIGDWLPGFAKPAGMNYGSCFYTLTTCTTPKGLVVWTNQGELFRFDAGKKNFEPLKVTGDKLEGSSVDNSTAVYDSKRDRLLLFRKDYGDERKYNGTIQAVDLKSLAVSALKPAGATPDVAKIYLCQIRYDETNDLLLVGGTLPPDGSGLRRTPAYDPAKDAWVSLKITGDDPSGKEGRNVSLGMMYDAKRKLFWAVDTDSHVFVMKLDPGTADVKALQ